MRSGYVAVIGRANAGKSTLINVMVGEKVSIVSPKPQTTRDRILGVLTEDDYQIVFVDTPGIYKARNALTDMMMRTTETSARSVDYILYVVDGHDGLTDEDFTLMKKYKALDGKNYYPDFYIPEINLFIEYFGVTKNEKKNLYKKELFEKDTYYNFAFIWPESNGILDECVLEIIEDYRRKLKK